MIGGPSPRRLPVNLSSLAPASSRPQGCQGSIAKAVCVWAAPMYT